MKNEELCKMFAYSFNSLKAKKNVAHADIKEALNIKLPNLWHYSNGKCLPRTLELIKLARYFDVSVEKLLGLRK